LRIPSAAHPAAMQHSGMCLRPLSLLTVVTAVQLLAPAVAQSPVGKVLQMLTEMKTKGAKDMEVERMVFESYAKLVRGQSRDFNYEITTAQKKVEELVAAITKHESDVQESGNQLKVVYAQSDTMEVDLKKATELREVEHSKFLEQQTSYAESLYALDRAIQLLKAQTFDRAQATALLQRTAQTLPGMRRVLAALALLQVESSSVQPSGAPAVAAYEFQSGNILDTLENLRKKFKEELGELEKEEMNAAHAYSMEEVHVGNAIENLKAEAEALAESKASAAAASAAAKDKLADTRANLAEAQKLLADITATFRTKKATFGSNQQVRKEELEAIGKAIEIMSQPEVVDSYAQHVKSFVQMPGTVRRSASFLQVRAAAGREERAGLALRYLQGRAVALRSGALATLAQQAGANPFAKVVDMIKALLERLKEEAASEADHKAYCDEELRKNKLKRDQMSSRAARLHAEIEEKSVEIVGMGKEMETLVQEQADLRKAMAESTAVRFKEKEANLEAISESATAQTALKQAIAVLREFYSKQGSSLLQLAGGKQVPEMQAYGGMRGAKDGVIGMLEVIESDFARVEADTRASEAQAVEQYKKFMEDSETDVKLKHDAEFKLSLEKDQAEFERGQLQKDLDATQEQLKMASLYYEELKPQCLVVHVSYEERAGRRQEEIKALQEAYGILDGKSAGGE